MKKIIYYIPFFFMLFLMIISLSIGSINTYFYLFSIIFLLSSVLLSQGKKIGGIIGIGGSIIWFYLALSNWKLQSFDFTIAGGIFIFYLGCMIYLLRKRLI